MDETTSRVVTGKVCTSDGHSPPPCTVIVQVEDVSRADAASTVVGESRESRVHFDDSGCWRFTVAVPAGLVEARAHYSLRVHVDVDDDGQYSQGDYLSTESYPVLTHGAPDRIDVRVRRI